MELQQGRLFGLAAVPVTNGPAALPPTSSGRDLFLTKVAHLMDAVRGSGALAECLRSAAQVPDGGRNAREGYGKAFETAALAAIEDKADTIAAEVIAGCATRPHGFAPVTSFEVTGPTGSTAAIDAHCWFTFADGSRYRVPVNVKVVRSLDEDPGDAVSLSAFVRLLTDPAFDFDAKGSPANFDADLALLEMAAGARRILPGRDYYLLLAAIDDDKRLVDWAFQGLVTRLSAARPDLPALKRNSKRATVEALRAGAFIPAGFDVNAAVAEVLLPAGTRGARLAQTYRARAAGLDPAGRKALAAALLAA